ncbi:MAG TPA: phospholipid carrier-dependent glycosyltransferase [Candidatus Binataceae bacterium]|nr:phospholipid carrier-dependent glycosyltransferase [Candidatus Binataceae bacterium]
MRIGIAAISIFALGAGPGGGAAPSGKMLGMVSATVLLAIVGYAFWLAASSLKGDREAGLDSALVGLVGLAVIKTAMLPFFPGFGPDVGSYQAWALQISSLGPAHTYQQGYFLDYPPGYLYALWVAGIIARFTHATGDALRVIVESPAIVADFFLAFTIFAYVRRTSRPSIAYAALLMVALNPALLFDTVVWGQSDSVLTFTMWLSVIAILDDQYEIGWAMAAVSVLVKPQGLMLLPMLAWWTMLETPVWRWVRVGLVGIAVFIIGIAPFQIGHPWNWILDLYTSTAAYYHETSVNAFNLIALLAGLRRQDSGTIAGISWFGLGMSLLAPLYGFVAWIVWRKRSAQTMVYAAFITVFGFFMVAPRMHERYLYPALVFSIPLALESTEMLAVFAILTLTTLFNLAYILHTLQTVVFLDSRDGLAMGASALNVLILGASVYYGAVKLDGASGASASAVAMYHRLFPARSAQAPVEARGAPLGWINLDTIIIAALLAAAVATRFWHLGHPPEIVFDEVHFVGQARNYLHGERFLDPHPPLAKLVIALGIWLFGDHSWGWRAGNACVGTALVGITYLLGRRMTRSRLAGALGASAVLLDGMFLVDSRVAVIDIVYLTLAAISYLVLFRIFDTPGIAARRRWLVMLGIALGLCVGSKLLIPAVTFLLVMGFLVWVLATEPSQTRRDRRITGAILLTGGVASICYIATFLPHYYLGWWGGIQDLFQYYKDIIGYEQSVSTATHPYSSKWWSWPLMLRPIAYWQDFPKVGKVSTIWGGGNPILWWGALTAITITAVDAVERPRLERSFLVIGYLGYLAIWIPIGRTLFLYHYMGSVYLGYVALGWILAQCWNDYAEPWVHLALLFTLTPAFILGLGWGIGAPAVLVLFGLYIVIAYQVSLGRAEPSHPGRYVCAMFCATAIVLFVYYFPIWTGAPIERAGYYSRMWLQEANTVRNWI